MRDQYIRSSSVEITGMGAVTPFGITIEAFWQAVTAGKNAFAPIRLFPTEGHRTRIAAEVINLPSNELRRVNKKTLSRVDGLALAAAYEALQHAQLLNLSQGCVFSGKRIGLVVGTAAGAILGLEDFFRKRAFKQQINSPQSLLSSFCLSAIATNIAREFVIEGPRMTIATVCSSSGLALAAAKELLDSEGLDQVLVVGAETISEVILAGFNSLRSVAPECCQPFDLNRKGIILGEGAGAMVLERAVSARNRKISPLACLSGYGLTTDLHHFTAPQPDGQAIAETIHKALANAALEPADIQYVNAHGTGTMLNDIAETRGLKTAFNEYAYKIFISSIKSMIGHTLGAASVLEAISTVLSLKHGLIPPTINLKTPDPECDLNYTPERARIGQLGGAISNSFAFGGSNISLVFSKNKRATITDAPLSSQLVPAPVITGIGIVSPIGIGRDAFIQSFSEGKSGLTSLAALGNEWAACCGGLVDIASVQGKASAMIRRMQNRQAVFLSASFKEALKDAGLNPEQKANLVITYGSAFGCSGNVHRFYSQLLTDGPRFTSPLEFNMTVPNAPPALMAQELGLRGPIWVVVGDEASWELSLHWAAKMIQKGTAEQVAVCAAEEISESTLAIHKALGLLQSTEQKGLQLGEGSVCMILESERKASERGVRPYGAITSFNTVQDALCSPTEYSSCSDRLIQAAFNCLNTTKDRNGDLLYFSPENGCQTLETIGPHIFNRLREVWPGKVRKTIFRGHCGESGIAGGMGLAAALLERPAAAYALILTSARGGIQAATLVQLGTGT